MMTGRKRMKMDKDPKDHPPAAQPPPPPPTNPVDKIKTERELEEVMNNVWSNDMLRKMILEHVIYPSPSTITTREPKINYEDISNLRLVEKSWLRTTSTILHQNRHPLYHAHNQNNFRPFIASAEEQKRQMTRFTQTMTRPRRYEPFIPPFSLSLICGFFIPDNHKVLSDLLVKCGTGLVSLNMVIPKSCSMSFVFPPFSLEILQRLTVEFDLHSHNDPDTPLNPSFLENSSVTYFIQQLMNSTRELKSIVFKYAPHPRTTPSVIPLGFQFLKLPPTVSALFFRGPFSPNHLEITTPRNQAHLEVLQIRISETTPILDENLINRVLERHGATLINLKLCDGKDFLHPRNDQEREPCLFKIPPMKNLQELTLSSPNWMAVNNFNLTSVNFPNLTRFKMKGISEDLFERITTEARRLRLQSVKTLEIWLINQLIGSTLPLNQDRMERAHRTFRSVTFLEITISGMETSGLKYIFREMGNLKSLGITVRKSNDDNDMTCVSFDGLLIGQPEWIAKGLRETPDYWEYFKGKIGHDNNPSIMNLRALSKLTLATKIMPVQYMIGGEMRGRLLSEVAIQFALVKMPALITLELFGRFQPNERMLDLWKAGGVYGGPRRALKWAAHRVDGK